MMLLPLFTYGTLDDCCLGNVMSIVVVVVIGLLISIGGVSGSPLDQKLPEADPVGVSIDADAGTADADAGASAGAAVEEVEEEDDDGVVVCIGGRGRVYCCPA